VFPDLVAHLDRWTIPPAVDADRLALLESLARYVAEAEVARLTFVCTHNSRRSHMAQLWAQAAAWRHGLTHVHCFSGGTEATAFHPNAIAAMRAQGFGITPAPGGHHISAGPDEPVIFGQSQVFDQPPNPTEDFAAIMVCTSADRGCPIVDGANLRLALPFVDPKARDGHADQDATYRARSLEIGHQVAWAMWRAAALCS